MYKTFFNLHARPFETGPDPGFLWFGEKYKEALSVLRYGVVDNKGFLLLTGGAGTGKTTLVNTLTEGFDESVRWAVMGDPNRERLDFYNTIAKGFGLTREFTSKVQFLIEFSNFLHTAHNDHKTVVLLIDNCHRLSQEMLEELRLLSNIEKTDARLINIFFVGRHQFHEMLVHPSNRAVRQRLAATVDLPPLTEDETEEYIRHRLQVAGTKDKIFSARAIQAVCRYSHGIPKNINIICHQALLLAGGLGKRAIDSRIVEESLGKFNELQGVSPQRQTDSLPGKKPMASHRGASPEFTELQNIISSHGPEDKGRWGWLKYGLGAVALAVMVATLWYQADKFSGATKVGGDTATNRLPARETPQVKLAPVVTVIEQSPSVINDKKAEELRGAILERAYANKAGVVRPEEGRGGTSGEDSDFDRMETAETRLGEVAGSAVGSRQLTAATEEPVAGTSVAGNSGQTRVASLSPSAAGEKPRDPPLSQRVILPLAPNSVQLTEEAKVELNRLVKELEQHPAVKLLVKGYVSSDAASPENNRLSEQRAIMVQRLLLARGIAADRIRVKGMGIEEPLASNSTSDGRTKNRRVEVVVAEDER